MPDIFVPLDTSIRSRFLSELIVKGTLNQFALTFTDMERSNIKQFANPMEFNDTYKISDKVFEELLNFANHDSIKLPSNAEKLQIKVTILNQLKALIARNVWRNEGYYQVINTGDKAIEAALREVVK